MAAPIVRRTLLFVLLLVAINGAFAENIIIPGHIWSALTELQKRAFKDVHDVSLIPVESYGIVVDAQTLNNSQPGNNAGSQLGASVGSAAYIDSAFRGTNWNYSATKNLAAGLIGAAIGSSLDTAPTAVFVTRYFIKQKNGTVVTVDEKKTDPFKIPPGICVELGPLRIAQDPICEATKETFLARLEAKPVMSGPQKPEQRIDSEGRGISPHATPGDTNLVKCKIGNSSPITIDKSKCSQIEGIEINE